MRPHAWLAFLALLAYLLVALGGVSHKDLLLNSPVKLPIIDVDIPLFSFFQYAPVLLLLVYLSLLIQHVILARKYRKFIEAIAPYEKRTQTEHPARELVHSYVVSQILAGPRRHLAMSCLMTKTLVALVLIAGGILLVTRLVDTDKPVPARLSPPTSADQMSEVRSVLPTMSAHDVCNLIDPWQKCSFSKPNIMVIDPKIGTQAAAVSLCNEFVVAVRGMRKVGKPMEPGWILQIHSSKAELASCYLP